ncbi:MAG: hypothetical protein GY725_18300 [bacterium]|nr:hypothetical protein [bacterium]
MLQTFDHVVIVVRDLEAATNSYQRLLGRKPSWRGIQLDSGTANSLFQLDNMFIELLSPVSQGEVARVTREALAKQGEGLGLLCFGTDDADALAKELRQRGLSASPPVPGSDREFKTGAHRLWRTVYLPETDTRGVRVFGVQNLAASDSLPAVELSCAAEESVSALDHIVINTTDPEAAIDLYREKLGLHLALDRSFKERGVRLIFFRIGGITVELAARIAGEPSDELDRFWGLAYRCSDVDSTRARLDKQGVDVSEVRSGNKPGTRVCTIRGDTCGVPTLLIGPDGEPR